jgi:predicted ATPase
MSRKHKPRVRQEPGVRERNRFRDPLVSELIEEPHRYRQMFSQQILAGETLSVFQPTNVVLVGPQGSGKSMILNLVRYSVLSEDNKRRRASKAFAEDTSVLWHIHKSRQSPFPRFRTAFFFWCHDQGYRRSC